MQTAGGVKLLVVIAGAIMLAGCQTTAEVAGESPAAVQMARGDGVVTGSVSGVRTVRTQTQNRPRVYLVRGLANIFSLGMDELAAKLNARGYAATVHEHGQWSVIAAEIIAEQRASGGRRQSVVIGHSLGADAVVYIANEVARAGGSMALAVAFDPVSRLEVNGGARRFVNLFQSGNGWAVALRPTASFRGRFENVDLNRLQHLNHFNIEKDPGLHNQVISWVGQAVGSQRRTAAR